MNIHRPLTHCIWLFILVPVLPFCGCAKAQKVDPQYWQEIQSWRQERLRRLQAEDGWLSLVGLYWLDSGRNSDFGSDSGCSIVLDDEAIPAHAGYFVLDDNGSISIFADPRARVHVNGEIPREGQILNSDATGDPDIVTLTRFRFYVISRDQRYAIRVKDPQASTRVHFPGIEYYPVLESMRVQARFEPYAQPKEVRHATAIGSEGIAHAPGLLHFTLAGQALTLEPWADDSESELFIVFRDTTSGHETYGAGRFLSAEPPRDGVVVLDFNRALNPPCAFTPYATCPLPPPVNALPVAVKAGERYTGFHH